MDLAYNAVPILRAVVSTIAMDVAARLEWHLYTKPGASRTIMRRVSKLPPAERRAAISDDLKEVESHEVLDLLYYYNDALGANTSEQVLQTWVDLFGSAYLLIESVQVRGKDVMGEIVPIHPKWVKKDQDNSKYQITRDGKEEDFDRNDLIIVRDVDPANPYSGGSGIALALKEELSADEMAALETTSFFRNGSMPGQVFMAKGADESQILRMKGQYEDLNRGPEKSWKTFWVDSELKIHERSTKFADADVSNVRAYLRDAAIWTFGVPPGLLGINVSENRATSTQAEQFYSSHVIMPRLERIRDAYQRQLLPRFGDDLLLDYRHPEIKDLDYLLDVAKVMPEALSRHDWRMMLGLDDADADLDIDEEKRLFFFRSATRLVRKDEDGEYEILVKPGSGAPAGPAPPASGDGDDPPADDDPPGDGDDPPADGDDPPGDDDPPTPPSQGIPGRKKLLIHLDPVVAALRVEQIIDAVDGDYWEIVSKFGQDAIKDVGADVAFKANDDRILRWIDARESVKIKGANEETAKAIRDNLIAGMENGESIDELKKRVRNVFSDARTWRARTIARTETIGSANFAQYEGQRQSGVVNRRQWIATLDERTREDHMALHLDTVSIDELFEADDGSMALHPGGFGVAHQDINCRCTTAALIEADDGDSLVDLSYGSEAHVALIRDFEDRVEPAERRFERHLRRGFAEQQRDVIAALEEQAV